MSRSTLLVDVDSPATAETIYQADGRKPGFGAPGQDVPLSSPDLNDQDRERVMAILNGRTLSLGPVLPAFEEALAKAAGAKYAIAVNSGTSGLHLCVKAAELGEGDEVITTPFSFVASANCMLYERAIPRFVDIEPEGYNIDVRAVEAAIGPRTRGILPVHVFGRPCDMAAINRIADAHRLAVIEDACEAIGAEVDGRRAGGLGQSGIFAFYPNKQITTGEGGAILTNDERIAMLCRSWRNQGRGTGSAWLQHERLGYNYRISDINCALGLGQVERLDSILAMRERAAALYAERLTALVPEVAIPAPAAEGTKISWFVYVVRLRDEFTREQRDRVIEALRASGIGCNNYFSPIHLQSFYQETFGYRRGDFPVCEHVADRTIALPFFNQITEEQIDIVAHALKAAVHSLRGVQAQVL